MTEPGTSPVNGTAAETSQHSSTTLGAAADLERFKLELAERRELREQDRAGKFAAAFAKAQANFKPVKRSRVVTVQTRAGGTYNFAYAPLDVILDATLQVALNREGFSVSQAIVKGEKADYVKTSLVHEFGERANMTPIFAFDAGPQAYNSALTYARRAGITLLLCIAAEEDDDANEAEGNQAKHAKPEAPQPAPNKPAPGKGAPGAAKAGKSNPTAQPHPRSGNRVVLDPGEVSHPQSAEDQMAQRRITQPAQADAFAGAPRPAPVTLTDDQMAFAEGRIADAIQDFHEAALEGRRGGIESIWEEIRHDEFVATQTWTRLKEQHPDSFRTVEAVLRSDTSTRARGDRGGATPGKPPGTRQAG